MLCYRTVHNVCIFSIVASLCGLVIPVGIAGEHPRLLISPADIPRLKHACGIGQPGEAAGWGRFGSQAADFQALRGYFAKQVPDEPLPGELLAAAFLHLVDPSDPNDAGRLRVIEYSLRSPTWVTVDKLEMVLALDWCWPDLAPAARREFMLTLRENAEGLTPSDSPLEARRFRQKLTLLALALAVDENEDPNPSWVALRKHLLESAREYFTTTFPTYVEWRGLSPTGPAAAAREENDTALAIELAGLVLNRDEWPRYRATVGRWLEHYLLAASEHPALQHNFIREDGNRAPLSPAPAWRELLPVTAHLIAVRTRDPAAALVAKRTEDAVRASPDMLSKVWRWVPIVLDAARMPRCNPGQMPTARNLGGAVIFRGGQGVESTAVWIDAGQPFLRRRQHFDAGHFLIYRGGHLAVGGGDDITFEAIPSKNGVQLLGRNTDPFDFEQYFTATIAHNCLVCWDAARLAHWYGSRYLPTGGQRCIDGTCTDFVTPPAAQGRLTARQLAYGQQQNAAYLALDLAPAYEARTVAAYTREFVFLCERVLVVIDRVTLTSSRSPPTWILNLPARPLVDDLDLADHTRVAGSTNEGGVWRYYDANWVRWSDRDGSVWLSSLRPAPKRLRIVGGPARKRLIADGPYKGRAYVGGEEKGFERLIIPAERHGAVNAWYRLGAPTLLGPEFGKTPHWGRIEIEPARPAETLMFLTVLITDRADAEHVPAAEIEAAEDTLLVTLRAGDAQAELRLPTGMQRGGGVKVTGTRPLSWTFPEEVQADEPLK
ncbi:MAG: heparinase II/III family protein [Phycisphaerae bacterium]|nr:heparinase II/III family protein [Phycisphaerae bacterium]